MSKVWTFRASNNTVERGHQQAYTCRSPEVLSICGEIFHIDDLGNSFHSQSFQVTLQELEPDS
jgi:hypothetical protein